MKKCFYLSSLLIVCFSLFSGAAKAAAVVTGDPVNVTACAGTTKWFGITATGATSYMWQVSADAGATWDTVHNGTVYTTATTDTMHVVVASALSGHMYRSIAYSTSGNDTSNAATLTVDLPSAGTISGPAAVCIGGNITFTSTVSGGTWSTVFPAISTISAGGVDTGHSAGMDTIKYSYTNTCGTNVSWKLVRVDANPTAFAITGPTSVCVGNNITLSNANTAGSFSWSSTTTSIATVGASTGIVHGVSGGYDLISYTFTNACNTVYSTISIHVETVIAPGTITGASSICNGSWTTLSNATPGGIWLSGMTSVAVVDMSGNVTGVSQGTSVISYYFSNSCGASVATHTINVVVAAAAIGGNDSVGIDSTLMLTNTTPGGTWTSGDVTIATVGSTGLVTGVDTGATTITYSVTNACGTSSATAPMNVGPLPYGGAINGPDSICAGATITLVDTFSVVPPTAWRSKWDTIATVSSTGVVTGVGTGIDTIYATITTAFGTTIVKKAVKGHAAPVVTLTVPATVSLGGSYTLIGTPAGGVFAVSNPRMTPLVGYGFIVVDTEGISIITYTAHNTCGTTSISDTVTLLDGTGVGNLNGKSVSLSIFPNPSTGTTTINLASPVAETANVIITNLLGQKIKEVTIMSNQNTQIVIDQPSGVYMISATTEHGNRFSGRINIAK